MAVVAFALSGLVAATGTATFRGQNGLIAFRSDGGNTATRESHAIWVVKPDGTDARKVTPGARPPNGETDYSPVFLPDGRRFAYVSQVFDENFSVKNQIYVKSVSAPANARGAPVLPEAVAYRILSMGISRNGRKLVLAAEPPPLSRTQIFLVSLDNGEMTQLTSGQMAARTPEFSADGGTIIFAARKSQRGGIFTVRTDGTRLRQLTSRPGDGAPSYSPLGTRIVFNRHAGGGIRIFSMRPDGSQETQLTDGPFVDRGPIFSPDGRSIAFSRAGAGSNPDIYAMRADGLGVHLVYRSRGRNFSDFAPDWGRKQSASASATR